MRHVPSLAAAAVAALLTASCGGGGDNVTATVSLYKSLGSAQCTGGGITISQLQLQLAALGIQALAASCGFDGNVYLPVCGAPDGRIGIVELSARDAQLAASIGFAALSTLPAPVRQACS